MIASVLIGDKMNGAQAFPMSISQQMQKLAD